MGKPPNTGISGSFGGRRLASPSLREERRPTAVPWPQGLGVAEQHIAAAHQDVDAAQLADAQRQDVGKHLLGHLQGVAGHKWAGRL